MIPRANATCALLVLSVFMLVTLGVETSSAQRVRVTMAGAQTVGVLHSQTDTTITLSTSSGLMHFSTPLVMRLEQSQGRRPNAVTGVIGMLLGAAVGGVAGCAFNSDDYGVFCGGQDDTKVAVGAVAGGVAGGLAGALLFKRERWQQIPLVSSRNP